MRFSTNSFRALVVAGFLAIHFQPVPSVPRQTSNADWPLVLLLGQELIPAQDVKIEKVAVTHPPDRVRLHLQTRAS